MNSSILQSLTNLAGVPDTDPGNWLKNAEQSVRFLTQICEKNEEIFLYASGPHFYVHSVLVPRAAVDPPDHAELARAHIMITDTWCIQRSYGGGRGHRVYLEPPLSFPGCRTDIVSAGLLLASSLGEWANSGTGLVVSRVWASRPFSEVDERPHIGNMFPFCRPRVEPGHAAGRGIRRAWPARLRFWLSR